MYSSSLPGGSAGSGSWNNPFAWQGPHFCLFLLNLDLISKASGWSLSAMAGSLPSQQVDTVHMCQRGGDLKIRSRHLSVDISIAPGTESCLHNSLGREGCWPQAVPALITSSRQLSLLAPGNVFWLFLTFTSLLTNALFAVGRKHLLLRGLPGSNTCKPLAIFSVVDEF